MIKKELILASQSPRRKEILEQAGIRFTVQPSHVEETYPPDLPIRKIPEYLAVKKANSIDLAADSNQLVLAADSIVTVDGQVLGKPKDYEDGMAMLRMMSGRSHEVITGVCIKDHKREAVFSEVAVVHMAEISEEEMDYYVTNYEPYDKAGGYGIQEWIGLNKIERIEGTYSNIKGLPMQMVYKVLQQFEKF